MCWLVIARRRLIQGLGGLNTISFERWWTNGAVKTTVLIDATIAATWRAEGSTHYIVIIVIIKRCTCRCSSS